MTVLGIEEQNAITLDIEEPEGIQVVVNPNAELLSSLSDVSLSGLATNDSLFYSSTTGLWTNTIPADARTALGLGTMAIQNASAVAITGGTIAGAELTDYAETRDTPTSTSGVLDIDLENGNVQEVELTENVTSTTFSNPPVTGKGGSFTLILKQDAGAGHTFVWPASVDWASATPPTLTTTTSAVDILTFVTTDAGTRWYGFLAGADMS